MAHPHRIVIVGAGFSGIAVATHLLRLRQSPSEIVMVNRHHRFGRGLAYGTRSGSHLLNVPAGRMGLDPGDGDGFVRFLRQHGHAWGGADFVPRKLYGDYLEAALEQAQLAAAPGVTLRLLQAEVQAVQPADDGVTVSFSDGSKLDAREAVMAWGNFAPRLPCVATGGGTRLLRDPWAPGALQDIGGDASVLLMGSGLTAYDVVLGLLDRGHEGPITMVSRRGLLPQPHRANTHAPHAGVVPAHVLGGARTAREQLRGVRQLFRAAAAEGHDWRDVLGELRPHTPRLWSQLDERSRRQFLRHLLPYWDTHRHRAAPQIDSRIRAALRGGQLRVLAGRLLQADAAPDRVDVQWRLRGQQDVRHAAFGAVVNCTGPAGDLHRAQEPLVRQMLADGLLAPDPLALGLEVDGDYRIRRPDGRPLAHVRYVGPLLKAGLWEATAVPELREHALRVATRLAAPQP